MTETWDVVILGAGLAGACLARHLLLDTEARVLLLERREAVPGPRQKVGESSVQVGGYYFSRVLDMEEHLLRRHFMKYNLRFYWPTAGRDATRFETYCQSYIRQISNIPSYQIDRNAFEAELLRLNREAPRCRLETGVRQLQVELGEGGAHGVSYEVDGEVRHVSARWVVDAGGRNRILAKKMGSRRPSSLRHGSFYWWVDGLVDVERLTDLSRSEIRKKKERRFQGHLPSWLATNHFCAEGLWFWIIPLQGKTSLGLVYDKTVVDFDSKDVSTPEKATAKVCELFPCLGRDLPYRRVLDQGGFTEFSHDCERVLHAHRWALTGDAGRFSDPLYSPGSDLIAVTNTLIVDAVRADLAATDTPEAWEGRCRLSEQILKSWYQAYLPTYELSYGTLGDAETLSLKYTWELSVYFAMYVFPFINELLVDRRFVLAYLRSFSRLGPINEGLQRHLSAYYRWKKAQGCVPSRTIFHDFSSLGPLAAAEKTFYEVGVSVDEAKNVLRRQMENLQRAALFVVAWTASVVVDDPQLLHDAAQMRALEADIEAHGWDFDVERIRRRTAEAHAGTDGESEPYVWGFDATVFEPFRQSACASAPSSVPEKVMA